MSALNEFNGGIPIEPVPAGVPRPLWSVMIPAFNCAKYLRPALESVLAQDPGLDHMQIEVVDDCSTKDDPEAVVREVGKGRAGFYRKPRNEGATANFNTCIQRSCGNLVHILHGDDLVTSDFYSRMASAADLHPDAALIASRVFMVDENGVVTGVTRRRKKLEFVTRNCSPFYYSTPIQCAGVVVRRAFYERHGGFNSSLVHAADCEMWSRAVASGGGIVIPEPLACYRVFEQNDSARIAGTAENLRDLDRLAKIYESRHPAFSKSLHRKRIARMAWNQAEHFRKLGMTVSYEANISYWRDSANIFQKTMKAPQMLYRKLILKQ
jgi:glycosyltransferase involved in cell wall biosynthesis